MPAIRKVIPKNIMPIGTVVDLDDYEKVKNAWLDRAGNLIYAGFWQHEKTAQLLGYDSLDAAEDAGLIHISESSFGTVGIPMFLHIPRRITDRQYDTLADYCAIHKIQNPALKIV